MDSENLNKVNPPLGWPAIDIENLQVEQLSDVNLQEIDELLDSERKLFKENWKLYKQSSESFTTGNYFDISILDMKNKQSIVEKNLSNVIKEDKNKNGQWWSLAFDRVHNSNSSNEDPFVKMVSLPGGPVPPLETIKMQADANLTLSPPLGLEKYEGKIIDKGSFSLVSFILWLFPFGILLAITLCTLILGGIRN